MRRAERRHTKSGTKTSPLNSSDMCGFEGPSPTGKATMGESWAKWSGSSGSVATREQLGEPNYMRVFNQTMSRKRRKVRLTFIPVTSPVDKGFVKVGPLPPVVTLSIFVRPPSESTMKDWSWPTGWISFTALWQTTMSNSAMRRVGEERRTTH